MKTTPVLLLFACLVCAASGFAPHEISALPSYGGALLSKNYAGYVNITGDRQYFYYFIESETDPTTDPLVLWLNGGPGCSSLLGLFTEIGPYLVRHDGKFARNQYTWVRKANVLFLESPGGVGFSKDHGAPKTNWTDLLTAQLSYEFLGKWLDLFPQFKGRSLHLTGESYAGHYVPQLAHQILHGGNADLKSMMRGFMVGNPCTGTANGDGLDWCFFVVDPTLEEYERTHALKSLNLSQYNDPAMYDPYDILERYCEWNLMNHSIRWDHPTMAKVRPHLLQAKMTRDELAAAAAVEKNHQSLDDPSGVLPQYGPCNAEHLAVWLNRPEVQAAIHADVGTHWGMCADIIYPTPTDIPGVLPLYEDFMANTTWDMLVYSGDADTVVNFIQTERVLLSLNRPPVGNFTPWYYTDEYRTRWTELGGYYQRWDRITWASVRGAGHMVPTYVPAAAWQLFKSFMETGQPGLRPVTGIPLPPPPSDSTTGVPPPPSTSPNVHTLTSNPNPNPTGSSTPAPTEEPTQPPRTPQPAVTPLPHPPGPAAPPQSDETVKDVLLFAGGIACGLLVAVVVAAIYHKVTAPKARHGVNEGSDYLHEK